MSKLALKAIKLIILALFVKVLGFAREMIMAYYYGMSIAVDVYVAAMNIPSVIFALLGTAITTTFIPLYSEISENEDETKTLIFTNNVLNVLVIIATIISIFGIIFSDILVKIFASGFTGETYEICNKFTKIIMVIIVSTVIQYIYNGYLQIHGNFNQNALMNLPYNAILIISIVISYYSGNFYVLAFGAVAASFGQLLYLKLIIRKTDFKYILVLNFRDTYIKKMVLLVGPVFLSTSINQLNNIIDRSLASRLVEGSISALNYSSKVNSIILEVVILSMTTILYPTLSKLFSANKSSDLDRVVKKYLNVVAVIVIPMSFMINYLSDDIIAILFGRGAFDEYSIHFTGDALKIYAIGLIGAAFSDVLNKIFYSMKDTKTPMINGIISVSLNIILNLILIQNFKYLGLAFATSFSSLVCTLLLMIQMIKRMGSFSFSLFNNNFIKILASTIGMYLTFILLENIITISNSLIKCLVFGCTGFLTYILILAVLHEDIYMEFYSKRLKKIK